VVTRQPWIRRRSGKVRRLQTDVLTTEPHRQPKCTRMMSTITPRLVSWGFLHCLSITWSCRGYSYYNSQDKKLQHFSRLGMGTPPFHSPPLAFAAVGLNWSVQISGDNQRVLSLRHSAAMCDSIVIGIVMPDQNTYRVVQKTETHIYFGDNFGNSAPIRVRVGMLYSVNFTSG